MPYPPLSLQGLAARWVQWAASSHYDCNPVVDETGAYADVAQPKDVWFLAGCFGGAVNRTCTIPANTKIFFPVFNIWIDKYEQAPDFSDAFGYLKIDGKEIELDAVFTRKAFVVKGVWGNPVTESVWGSKLNVGGFWKLIEPLSPGVHDIYFRGGNGNDFIVEVSYKITVNPI